jgi:hypothetical protein
MLVVLLVCLPRAAAPQAGVPLGPEYRVNTYTTASQAAPSVATSVGGSYLIVWESPQDGSGTGIFGQRYTGAGVPQGPEFLVNTFTTGNQSAPAALVDLSGNFAVVWSSELQDGSGLGLYAQRYASSGAPAGTEFRVNTYTTGDQLGPAVAIDKSGIFFVLWTSDGQDGSGPGVFAQRYIGFGPPLGGEFRVNTTTAGAQGSPAVAASQSGIFVVVWQSDGQDGSGQGVFGQRYISSGTPSGPEFRVNSFTTGGQLAPSVAAGSGTFVVAWQSQGQDGSGYGVIGQRFVLTGAPVGPELIVNTFTAGDQAEPSIVADITGDFAVVWSSAAQDGQSTGVFGQRVASDGTAQGPEFRVNTYTTAAQRSPSATATFGGNFIVAWQSDQQDGSQYGVFSQRYGPIVPVELMRFGVE